MLAGIRNFGGRDFDKKKLIIAGIYLCDEPNKLIGLAELLDYKKRLNQITIGYHINESYWHRGMATDTVRLIMDYLYNDLGVQKNWDGKEIVDLNVFTRVWR